MGWEDWEDSRNDKILKIKTIIVTDFVYGSGKNRILEGKISEIWAGNFFTAFLGSKFYQVCSFTKIFKVYFYIFDIFFLVLLYSKTYIIVIPLIFSFLQSFLIKSCCNRINFVVYISFVMSQCQYKEKRHKTTRYLLYYK